MAVRFWKTKMTITLRPLNLDTDAPRYAELLSITSPKPIAIGQVHEWEEHYPRDGIRQRCVALDEQSVIVGYNNASHVPYMLPNSFWIDVTVLPDFRRRGIGEHLYDNAVEFATAQGATRLECEVRDYNPDWLRFAQTRGFQVDRHIFESTLDLATFDESRFAGVIESVQAQDIRFFTLADAGNTEENQRKLYEVNKRNALDIPGSEGTFPRFEDFRQFVFQASWFRPQGQILAADGERWVGLSAVGYFANTNSAYNMHTGVLKEYRGRKIALALKLLAIRRSREWGAVYLRTNNDSQNAPILAINEKLGYKPQPGLFRCLKELST
jgi:GNAT superfamily N-acetyltransferase